MISPLSSNLVNGAAHSGGLQTALQRLASGQRIQGAADDAAGQAILTALGSQARGEQQASRNTLDVLALADTAGGALGQITDSLQRMRELAVQAANGGVFGSSDLRDLQTQIAQQNNGIDQTVTSSLFNGQPLLDGRLAVTAQTGADAGQTQSLTLPDARSAALGVDTLDVGSAAGAGQAIAAIDDALARVSTARATLGGAASAFEATADVARDSATQTAATASRLGDTDYAAATTQLHQDQVRNTWSLKAVALYNSMQADKLALLKKSP